MPRQKRRCRADHHAARRQTPGDEFGILQPPDAVGDVDALRQQVDITIAEHGLDRDLGMRGEIISHHAAEMPGRSPAGLGPGERVASNGLTIHVEEQGKGDLSLVFLQY